MMLTSAARHLSRGSPLTRAGSKNPYYSPDIHRYMVAEETTSDGSIRYHAVELIGTDLPLGNSYDQLVLYSDLGDVSCFHSFLHPLLFDSLVKLGIPGPSRTTNLYLIQSVWYCCLLWIHSRISA
jgi:hypothetical protein